MPKFPFISGLSMIVLIVGCGAGQPTATSTPTIPPIEATTISEKTSDFEQFVYQVNGNNCGTSSQTRIQTGFKVKSQTGIYTALHGVVGCQNITALTNKLSYTNLQIKTVDISKDIAFLSSSELTDLDGIELAENTESFDCGNSQVINIWTLGYPNNIRNITKKTGSISCTTKLQDVLPSGGDVEKELQKRQSPRLTEKILQMELEVRHGHSGSPILRKSDNRLLGMVIGGLFGDPKVIQSGWGIPFPVSNLQFQDRDVLQLEELKNSPIPVSENLTTFFALDPERKPELYLKMKDDQSWDGIFEVDEVLVDRPSCIAIYSTNRINQDSVKIGERVFNNAEPVTQVSFLSEAIPGQEAAYTAFCQQLEILGSLELYAYLFETENDKCTDKAMESARRSEIKDTFQVTIDHNNLPFTGFCKQ